MKCRDLHLDAGRPAVFFGFCEMILAMTMKHYLLTWTDEFANVFDCNCLLACLLACFSLHTFFVSSTEYSSPLLHSFHLAALQLVSAGKYLCFLMIHIPTIPH